eukprot:Clim_evm22s151 gene=Clim_evmTU22s151
MLIRSILPRLGRQIETTAAFRVRRSAGWPQQRRSKCSFVFDIDGVLVRGHDPIPRARDALIMVKEHQCPFILLTNGGGVTEGEKAEQISRYLDVEITPEQVVQSHTPMQMYTKYYDHDVLVLGQGKIKEVAESYGFQRVHTIEDIQEAYPILDFVDFKRRQAAPGLSWNEEFPTIRAIFVMSDPIAWESHVQIISDLVFFHGKPPKERLTEKRHSDLHEVDLVFTNPDIMWAATYSYNRIAQGAFRQALESVYKLVHGVDLPYTQFGKPHELTYEFAERVLRRQGRRMGMSDEEVRRSVVYGVGDNPLSDIRGANNRPDMRSILVKSGVHSSHENDPHDPADYLVEDVYEGVVTAIQRHS